MLVETNKEWKKPIAQDMAISNLLEIDLKDQEDLNIWAYNKSKIKTKGRAFSLHSNTNKNNSGTHAHRFTPIRNPQRYKNSTSLRESNAEQIGIGESKFNQGQYWSSKITWMTPSHHIREHSSQPKLNKKYTFGYEVNGRRRKNNEEYERGQGNQYKTNLVYSVLNHQDVKRYKQESMVKLRKSIDTMKNSRINSNHQSQIISKENQQQKVYKKQENSSSVYSKVKKIDQIMQVPQSQREQRNLMMIKELLVDLQLMRNYENEPFSNDKKVRVNRWNIKKSMVKIQ